MKPYIINLEIINGNIILTYNDYSNITFSYNDSTKELLLNYLKQEKVNYKKQKLKLKKDIFLNSLIITFTVFFTILNYIYLNSFLFNFFISISSIIIIAYYLKSLLNLYYELQEINNFLSYPNITNFLREEYYYIKNQKIVDIEKFKYLRNELGYKRAYLNHSNDYPKILKFIKK